MQGSILAFAGRAKPGRARPGRARQGGPELLCKGYFWQGYGARDKLNEFHERPLDLARILTFSLIPVAYQCQIHCAKATYGKTTVPGPD